MATQHDRTIASFPSWARTLLTNGGTVVGGNGMTYKYDPYTGMATPISAPQPAPTPTSTAPAPAPVPVATSTPTAPATTSDPRIANPVHRGLPGPSGVIENRENRYNVPGASPAPAPEPYDLDPNDKDGNGVPDYIDEQRKSDRRNALELLKGQFKQYGIDDPSFVQYIHDLLVQGYDASTISLMIQDHQAYKERFKGNEARRAKGLGVLSPAEYIAVEGAYAQILRASGLPPGFYDDPKSDFADWIGRDVSPAEIKQRADLAIAKVNDSNPEARKALAEYYGITDSMLAAYYLDDKRALPILQKQSTAADIGAAARRQGLRLTDRAAAEQYADLGIDGREARDAYGRIAEILPATSQIARRFGQTYGQEDGEQELLGGMASARRKRERLYQSEVSLFSGQSGVTSKSLARDTGGSY